MSTFASHPLVRKLSRVIAAVVLGSDLTTIIGKAPAAGKVSAVTFIPNAAIAGAATNNRKLELVNKGQSGAGSTVVATLQYGAGVNGVAFDEQAFTNGVAANLVVAEGDVLVLVSTHIGTGIADPGGQVEVTFTNNTD